MRDIKLVKLSRSKSKQQYKVYNNKCKGQSRTVKKQKLVQEKKKIQAEQKDNGSQYSMTTGRCDGYLQDEETLSNYRHRSSYLTGKLILNFLINGEKSSARRLLLFADGDVSLTYYDPANNFSALGYALTYCPSSHSLLDDLFCYSMLLDLKEHEGKMGFLDLLMDAAENKYESWNNILGKNNICLNLQDSLGNTLLHYASIFKRPKSIKRLLQAYGCLEMKNKKGDIPIHLSCIAGCIESITVLLEHGCSVDKKNASGFTPLHIACENNHRYIVSLLLKYEANPFIEDDRACNALCIAVLNKADAIVSLLKYSRKMTIEDCGAKFLKYILDELSQTELVEQNDGLRFHSDLLQILDFCHFAKWNAVDNFKLFIVFCEYNVRNWSQLLNVKKNLIFYKNKQGNTLLHYACRYEKYIAVEKLVKLGAHVDEGNKDGNTALHVCGRYDYHYIANILLSSKKSRLNIDHRNTAGFSALAMACKFKSKKTIEVLVRHGANVNTGLKTSISPIEVACKTYPCVIPFFLHYGANIQATHGDLLEKLFYNYMHNPHRRVGWPFALFQGLFGRHNNLDMTNTTKNHIQFLISAGGKSFNIQAMIDFERYLCNSYDKELILFLLESGYRFHISLDIPQYLQKALSQPLSLKLLTSCKIRTNLFPNAWYSVHRLPLPSILKHLVVMGHCGRDIVYNFETWMLALTR